jgi:DNA-binding CsgD family transcriptional regulator
LPLYGREPAVRALDGLLEAVDVRGGAVVVRGAAGIGKSSVLAAASASAKARGLVVLTTSGVSSEANLPFAGLHQLLQPLVAEIEKLPPPQREALKGAFGLTDAGAPEMFLIALATLELLADAAAAAPVLVIAEDAQWLDGSTSDVLAFVARRVGLEPIVLLAAIRDGWDSPLVDADLPELRLEPLDAVAAEALLDEHAPDLAPDVRERLLNEAEGNPLALVELPRALRSEDGDGAMLSEPLPLTARLERAFAERALELSDATRTTLLIAAANDRDDLGLVLRAAGVVDDADVLADVLEPAVAAQLIKIGEGTLSFRHPLVRSAIYEAASFSERRRAHVALAEALADEPDRRVWHRAAGSVGPDRELATELEEAASRARERGATAVALAALERAAKLSQDPTLRAGRLLRAGEMAFELAGPELGIRFLREAEPLELSAMERARLSLLRELFEDEGLWAGTTRVATFIETVDRVRAAGEAELALNFLLAVAQRCWWVNLEQGTRDLVVAAAERIPGPRSAENTALTAILAFADPIERGADVIDRISRLEPDAGLDSAAIRLIGAAATAVGAFDLSPGFLASSVDGLRTQGRLGLLAQALVSQAWAAVFLGNWAVATPAAEEAGRLARETAQPRWAAAADLAEATLAGLRGDYEAADALASEAERLLLPMSAHPTLAFAQVARGLAALGRGAHFEAYGHLRRMFDPADIAYHPFVRFWVVGDLAEAAVRSGHRDEALAQLETFEAAAQKSRSPLLLVGLRYARPLLADDVYAEALFQTGLSADLTAWPFYRGRMLLAFGSWLRRQRRVAESRTSLRAARDCFDALGAIPWGDRARQELRASGETSRSRTPEARDQLTPQELQIARMAADGLTNRDIGQQLYLSHRTIGAHLRRIFTKLGVASRRHLTAALAGDGSSSS